MVLKFNKPVNFASFLIKTWDLKFDFLNDGEVVYTLGWDQLKDALGKEASKYVVKAEGKQITYRATVNARALNKTMFDAIEFNKRGEGNGCIDNLVIGILNKAGSIIVDVPVEGSTTTATTATPTAVSPTNATATDQSTNDNQEVAEVAGRIGKQFMTIDSGLHTDE